MTGAAAGLLRGVLMVLGQSGVTPALALAELAAFALTGVIAGSV